MNVFECDRCKTILRNEVPAKVHYTPPPIYDGDEPKTYPKDLCESCVKSFLRWLTNATALLALVFTACGGAGTTTENPAHEPLPYHCQVFIATARVCIAQRESSERAELEATLQSTIDMWQAQKRAGVTVESLDFACEQSSGWGSDLAYCPEE